MAWGSVEKRRAWETEYNARNKEKTAAKHKRWAAKHHEHMLEYMRRYREEHREKMREYSRRAEEKRRGARSKSARKNKELEEVVPVEGQEERSEEMKVRIEKCPRCRQSGAVKLVDGKYIWGCTNRACEEYVMKPRGEALRMPSMKSAVGMWNCHCENLRRKLAEEEAERRRKEAEEAKADEAEETPTAPKDAPADEEPTQTDEEQEEPSEEGHAEEDASEAGDGGEPDEAQDKEEASEPSEESDGADDGEESSSEEEEAEGEEDDEELCARFWLELDGVWYWLKDGDGCDGCAFCLAFGRRTFCAAQASDDFAEAAELCKRLDGVWQKNDDE